MKKSLPTIYLYNNIFFPQTIIPINVNDQLTKELLISAYENHSRVLLYHPNEFAKGVATIGEVLSLEKSSDGTFQAVMKGLNRVKLVHLDKTNQDNIPHYFIQEYSDHPIAAEFMVNAPIEKLNNLCQNFLKKHITSTKDREFFLNELNSPSKLVNNLCMLVVRDVELKQIFLECPSLIDRIRMLDALLGDEFQESENIEIAEAIKKFERLDNTHQKMAC